MELSRAPIFFTKVMEVAKFEPAKPYALQRYSIINKY